MIPTSISTTLGHKGFLTAGGVDSVKVLVRMDILSQASISGLDGVDGISLGDEYGNLDAFKRFLSITDLRYYTEPKKNREI